MRMGRLWYARWGRYPVSPGHLLLIPCRHVADLFDATDEEMTELPRLLQEAKALLDHLIPLYRGDMDDPRGGVRGTEPAG